MAAIPTTQALIQANNALKRINDLAVTLHDGLRGNKTKSVAMDIFTLARESSRSACNALSQTANKEKGLNWSALNAVDDLKASCSALGLCMFLFERMDSLDPGVLDYAETINSFAAIGIQLAGSAQDAAFSASATLRKELGHE